MPASKQLNSPPLVCCHCGSDGLSQAAMDALLSFAAMNRAPIVLLEFNALSEANAAKITLTQQLEQLSEFGIVHIFAHCYAGFGSQQVPLLSRGTWINNSELLNLHRQANATLSY